MDRKDVPNLVERYVMFVDLKTEIYNNKSGFVISWNEESERFAVELQNGEDINPIKLFKPMNLAPCSSPIENEKAIHLFTIINSGELTDLDQGILLFQEIEDFADEPNYEYMGRKIQWLGSMLTHYTIRDKSILPKIQKLLENIIEICNFEDLLVQAKIFLVNCLMTMGMDFCNSEEVKPYVLELSLSCVENHYGNLPALFGNILMLNYDSQSTCGNVEIFEFLQSIYEESKNMILNRTCVYGGDKTFYGPAVMFLENCEKFNLMENVEEEIRLVREMLPSAEKYMDVNLNIAQTYFVQNNFEETLYYLEKYQEDISTNYGNQLHHIMPLCYSMKLTCYMGLGKKELAKKTLKQLKKFKNCSFAAEACKGKIESTINNMTEKIENECSYCQKIGARKKCGKCNRAFYCTHKCQKKHWKNGHKEKCNAKVKVRTRMKCSSFSCTKVESQVGDFKSCGKCGIAYYCSRECQKRHWFREGHKKDCQN